MTSSPTVAAIALARPTFDVEYAMEVAGRAFVVLESVAPGFIGRRDLCLDEAGATSAIQGIDAADPDVLVVLQATFTDASMAAMIADRLDVPLVLWAFPEDRLGGRLRLNSLCGINLAGHALARLGRTVRHLYRRPDDPSAADRLGAVLTGESPSPAPPPPAEPPDRVATAAAVRVADALRGMTTGVIGDHPVGFTPSTYDADEVARLTGVTVEKVELDQLFARAEAASSESVDAAGSVASDTIGSIEGLDPSAVEQSLRLYCGMRDLIAERGWSGFATRCWPECFTEFGGAACTPHAMSTDQGVPGGCEADAYGTLTSLILMELSGEAPFVADLVDLDPTDDTGTFWHCGLAPASMADPDQPRSLTIHSNRQLPLLNEFALKPGPVTIARLSQAGGSPKLMVGSGEMLRAPLPFSGTAGVVRFDRPVGDVLETIMAEGLEHHYGIVYGRYEAALRALAAHWNIPVVTLS